MMVFSTSSSRLRNTGWGTFAGHAHSPRARFLIPLLILLIRSIQASAVEMPRPHWAYQPLVPFSGTVPEGTSLIDAALSQGNAAKTSRAGSQKISSADRAVLLRRLSFDLRGLPPTPEELKAFASDPRPDAYERWVDTFLNSSQYGERWGRHWLDWVGYADSNGYFNADSDRPLAWKYRDYVVRSIQKDKALNQFIREQIAGDEYVGYVSGGDVTPEMVDPLIATHFWRNVPDGTGESDGNPLEVKVDRYTVLEGNVQLFGAAFLGFTFQCARCHEHKFEPVSQEDYYGFQAILRPVFDPEKWLKPNERVIEVGTRAERADHARRSEEARKNLATLKQSLEGLYQPFRKQWVDEGLASLPETERKEVRAALDVKEKDRSESMKKQIQQHSEITEPKDSKLEERFPALGVAARALRTSIQEWEAKQPAPLEKISAVFESTNPPPVHHLFVRGNHAQEGHEVPPGVPAAIVPTVSYSLASGSTPVGKLQTSGRRLALAEWTTSPSNSMVLRMLMNRVWKAHFGQGVVATVENLGRSGAKPKVDGLLDAMACAFVQSGWSLKQLNRSIVTSEVYRGTRPSWVEEGDGHRLDAESIRDAMLQASGELDGKMGGPYIPTVADAEGQIIIDEKTPGAFRRSLYLQHRRTHPVDFLSVFDGPSHNPVCIQRIPSTVAQQSLTLLNSEFVRSRARAFARRLLAESNEASSGTTPSEFEKRFERACWIALGRASLSEERAAAWTFYQAQSQVYLGKPEALQNVWTDLCQMVFASNGFIYVD